MINQTNRAHEGSVRDPQVSRSQEGSWVSSSLLILFTFIYYYGINDDVALHHLLILSAGW